MKTKAAFKKSTENRMHVENEQRRANRRIIGFYLKKQNETDGKN